MTMPGMALREPDLNRVPVAVGAGLTVKVDLSQYNIAYVSGAEGVFKMKATVPAASGNLLSFALKIGQRQQITSYAIPAEEAVGAGPTTRITPITVRGYRGDPIDLRLTNPTGGSVTVVLELGLLNVGR